MSVVLPGGFRSAAVTMLASGAKTSSDVSSTLTGVDNYSMAEVELDVTVVAGTSPTLDVRVQKLMADGTNWSDIAAFPQVTTGTPRYVWPIISAMPTSSITTTDGSLTANTAVSDTLGSQWRIKYTIGGTSPSFTFSVNARFYA